MIDDEDFARYAKQSNVPDDVLYVDVGASTIEWKESGK